MSSLKTLGSSSLTHPCFTYLSGFLSQDQEQKLKLSFCPVTEFKILGTIGSGGEGLVLKCCLPQDSKPVALKLFFVNEHQTCNLESWPLRGEALYYASCAHKRAYYSDPSNPLPTIPQLPYTERIQRRDQIRGNQDLFNKTKDNVSMAGAAAIERDEIVSMLDTLCANGWVAFKPSDLRVLQKSLRNQESQNYRQFTGDIIVGIVKPFIEYESEATKGQSLQRQILIMSLMRSFGWRLREFQVRNWISGYLVDGGDVDVDIQQANKLTYERGWSSAISQLILLQRPKRAKVCKIGLATKNGGITG